MFLHYNMFFMYSNRQLALPSILLNGPRGELLFDCPRRHNLPTIYILIFNMNDFFYCIGLTTLVIDECYIFTSRDVSKTSDLYHKSNILT
jgi:hypothetical protein